MCVRIIVHKCRTQHNTTQNSSDNFPSYPPDNHHSSDDVYCRGGGEYTMKTETQRENPSPLTVTTHVTA